jgi:hypothetical protein
VASQKNFLPILVICCGLHPPQTTTTTSSGPFARGTVTAIAPITPNSPMVVVVVSWADGATTQVNVTNLEFSPATPRSRLDEPADA